MLDHDYDHNHEWEAGEEKPFQKEQRQEFEAAETAGFKGTQEQYLRLRDYI